MPRKKISRPETRTGDDITDAEPGDYCYYLNMSNRPAFAEIKRVFTENDILVLYLVCQTDFKHLNVPAKICAFEEKLLKGKKRYDLCPEVYNVK